MEESKQDFCRIYFRVRCPTKHGQTVALSGFDGKEFFPLVTTPEAYPLWTSSLSIVLPKGSHFSYKYCIMEKGVNKGYEKLLTPRQIVVNKLDLTIEDEFDPNQLETTKMKTDVDILGTTSSLRRAHDSQNSKLMLSYEEDSRLFLVCYHLPVSIKRTNRPEEPFVAHWAESLIAKTSNSISSSLKTLWIGTISLSSKDLTEEEKVFVIELLGKMDCIPVFLDPEIASDAYTGFCKTILWPVFHNVDQLDQIHAAWNLANLDNTTNNTNNTNNNTNSSASTPVSTPVSTPSPSSPTPMSTSEALDNEIARNKVFEWHTNEIKYHNAFRQVNTIFTQTILAHVHTNDIVWIHDYHLILVPKIIRDLCPNNSPDFKIIFFLHIPFPTSQIFRTLPEATEILESMVSADLVGFHAFDHARHFLNASKRMLGIRSNTRQGGMLTLSVQDREVIVTMSHVSIETDLIDQIAMSEETLRLAQEYKTKYEGKRIILGIDVCQRLSGIALKMAAFEKFATDYNINEKGGVVLIQRSIRQGSRVEDEETTSNDVKRMVQDINSKFIRSNGNVFIDYQEISHFKGLSSQERLALYLVADVFLITPVREGLNLWPSEYIYVRRNLPRAGVVIASEFSTCSSLLNGSLKVNPFNSVSVADSIEKALAMSNKDCEYRRQRDLPFISSHPSAKWTRQILSELDQLTHKRGHGRIQSSSTYPDRLIPEEMIHSYEKSLIENSIFHRGNRVFIFDYGGTLLQKERYDIYMKQTLSAIAGRKPSASMIEAVKKLSEDPGNIVMVITGLTKGKLGMNLKGLPNIAIATGNGLVSSWGKAFENQTYQNQTTPSNTTNVLSEDTRAWEVMSDSTIDWQIVNEIAVSIMNKYTYRTNGTCVSSRFPGVGWSYFGADPDWGKQQAIQLQLELEAGLAQYDVNIKSLVPGSIEVVPKNLVKGKIVTMLLNKVVEMRAGRVPDMITVMSADEADDGMIQAVYDFIGAAPPSSQVDSLKAFTVAVGKKVSPAKYYVNDVMDVESLLSALNNLKKPE